MNMPSNDQFDDESTTRGSSSSRRLLCLVFALAALGFAMILGLLCYLWPSYRLAGMALLCFLLSGELLLRFFRGTLPEAEAWVSAEISREIVPSKRLAEALTRNRNGEITETPLVELHEHPVSLSWWVLIGATWSGLCLFVAVRWVELTRHLSVSGTPTIGWVGLAWLLGMAVVAVRVKYWRSNRYCFTNERVLALVGWLRHKDGTMPLKRLADEVLEVTAWSRLLAWLRIIYVPYGRLTFESAGEHQTLNRLVYLPWARQLNPQVMHMVLDREDPGGR